MTTPKDTAKDEDRSESRPGGFPAKLQIGFDVRRAIVALVVILLAGGAGTLTLLNRQARQSDEKAEQAQAEVAANIARLLSWDADNLDAETQKEMQFLTDEFAADYDELVRTNIAPAAKDGGLSAAARVVGQGVISLEDDEAVLLYLVNVKVSDAKGVQSEDDSGQTEIGSRIKVVAVLEDGKWLISSYDPI
jgi:hypothetical protein